MDSAFLLLHTIESIVTITEEGNIVGGRCLFFFFKAAPKAYGGSQARGQIRAVTASLHHGHDGNSNNVFKRIFIATLLIIAKMATMEVFKVTY